FLVINNRSDNDLILELELHIDKEINITESEFKIFNDYVNKNIIPDIHNFQTLAIIGLKNNVKLDDISNWYFPDIEENKVKLENNKILYKLSKDEGLLLGLKSNTIKHYISPYYKSIKIINSNGDYIYVRNEMIKYLFNPFGKYKTVYSFDYFW
ncbi:MAG: hypothetical protein MJB14_06580, partial [Spirochaetes bacterium]|nr:hypothetical protein [Spirochaetota bacterium]